VDGVFDAAVSWGMLFHLEPRDQAAAFAAVSRVLKPGAPFLFTAAEIPDVPARRPGHHRNDERRDVPVLLLSPTIGRSSVNTASSSRTSTTIPA
jgi:hypothetical protein